jgi:hypothetical protein
MWISKHEYKELISRLEQAEKWIKSNRYKVEDCEIFSIVCSEKQTEIVLESHGPYQRPKRQEVTVRDAIQMILDKLGLKIEYVDGEPDTKALAKK